MPKFGFNKWNSPHPKFALWYTTVPLHQKNSFGKRTPLHETDPWKLFSSLSHLVMPFAPACLLKPQANFKGLSGFVYFLPHPEISRYSLVPSHIVYCSLRFSLCVCTKCQNGSFQCSKKSPFPAHAARIRAKTHLYNSPLTTVATSPQTTFPADFLLCSKLDLLALPPFPFHGVLVCLFCTIASLTWAHFPKHMRQGLGMIKLYCPITISLHQGKAWLNTPPPTISCWWGGGNSNNHQRVLHPGSK